MLQTELSSASALLIQGLDLQGGNLKKVDYVLIELFDRLERFFRRNDPAFIIKEKERETYRSFMKDLTKEASFHLGREVTEEEILKKGKEHAKRQKLLSMGHHNRCPNCHAPLVHGDPAGGWNRDLHGGPS